MAAASDIRQGELTPQSPLWDRLATREATSNGQCSGVTAFDSVNDAVAYQTFRVRRYLPGFPLTVSVDSLEPTPIDFDPVVFVYCNAFNPSQPLINLIALDDDSAGYPNALASVPGLFPSTSTYVVVVSSYSNWAPSRLGRFEVRVPFGYEFLPDCPADINADGLLNFFDVAAYLARFNANDPSADLNQDGLINFFDISRFLQLYNAGCP